MNYKKLQPALSKHFKSRASSGIRLAQTEFSKRPDKKTQAINVAIGNVSLPMHPAMIERSFNLDAKKSPFKNGVVKYTSSAGFEETNRAFMHIIASSGFKTEGLSSLITDGSSHAMELVILGICGRPGKREKPLLLLDPAYTNYNAMAERLGRNTVSVSRELEADGRFSLPDFMSIELAIKKSHPAGLLTIPYDNPTGQWFDQETMVKLAKIAVSYNLWLISDEAYRELCYVPGKTTSIWGLTEDLVPGITGRRISLETASKVWNACGLRIGAIVTDNPQFQEKAVAENTANLCAPTIDQYIFGALAHVSFDDLFKWYKKQRSYYQKMMLSFTQHLKATLPKIIISRPDASIYSVVDVRDCTKSGFNAYDFVMFCAQEGKVDLDGQLTTLLVAPMAGFYNVKLGEKNPGQTQMRIAYVETPEKMAKIPQLFARLLEQYESKR